MTRSEAIEILQSILSSQLFWEESLTTAEAVVIYAASALLEKACQDRKKQLRKDLLEATAVHGRPTKNGGHRLETSGIKVMRSIRQDRHPNEQAFKQLLLEKGIELDEAYDRITKLVLNPSKIDSLVSLGKLAKGDVEELKGSSEALRVSADDEFKAAIRRRDEHREAVF